MTKVILTFFVLACGILFSACDPKIDQRAPRFDPHLCPVSNAKGVCRNCAGDGKCPFCRGTGTRVSSTKGFAGAGLNQIDYEVECPFCFGSGVCSHCEGAKVCRFCEGTSRVEPGWSFLTGIFTPRKDEKEEVGELEKQNSELEDLKRESEKTEVK